LLYVNDQSMLKIGIIGSGDIARKAYLPVISTRMAEIHFFARNPEAVAQLSRQYGINHTYNDLESLMHSGITAAFVHTSTSSHYEIIKLLLTNNIHVYVDKPVTYNLESTAELFEMARSKNLHLMVGFNRRYAPGYQKLRELQDANMIIMQKNRKSLPADARTFVFDDFIHVVDTLLYLFPHRVENFTVTARHHGGLLHHIVVQFVSREGAVAIGIMNRDSGTVEEKLEVFTPIDKWVVNNVSETIVCRDKNQMVLATNDWDRTLYKRGFEQIIDEFLSIVQASSAGLSQEPDPLMTHNICEEIVQRLANDQNRV
jgi:virulence factor